MSEFKRINGHWVDFRWQLLATVSAVALFGFACEANRAHAASADSDHPQFWIELGGQFTGQKSGQESYLPPFLLTSPRPPFETASPATLESAPPSSWDGSVKMTFQPDGTPWAFSAKVLYGRSNRNRSSNEQNAIPSPSGYNYNAYQRIGTRSAASHVVADFQAGKDVGLGMFGRGGTSIVSLGLRYAQFISRSNSDIASQPTAGNRYHPYNKFYGTFSAERKFSGIGPSLSWDASSDLIGSPSSEHITLDWGANAALLFGRQRTVGHHQTTNSFGYYVQNNVYHHSVRLDRSRNVTVPNLGGFAGVSWQYTNAKVSLGYRADFFFGAIDGGIDARKTYDRSFFGPYASISIGLGG